MELNQEQVKRIDSFLQGIGIEYLDIRLEMVDHIASEIEEKVVDKDAFFENKRFQTPFIKYMLSIKTKLVERYEKQEKRLSWFCLKIIFKETLKQIVKIHNLNLIALITVLCFIIGPNFLKETTIVMFILSLGILFFGANKASRFYKKYKDVKIIRMYTIVISFVIITPFQFPDVVKVFFSGNYNLTVISVSYVSFVLGYLLNQSFIAKKTEIEKKYKFLIS